MPHCILPCCLLLAMTATASTERPELLEALTPAVERMDRGAQRLAADRRTVLDSAADFVARRLAAEESAELVFICTHNSRRSHLAQIWAQVAAEYYGLEQVQTYSGGTEATACNLRTVQALRRAGLEIVATTNGNNPRYLVQYAENRLPIEVFSKVYDAAPNPANGFAAMMCCADVDEECPVVHGAELRVPLHYVDPKASDGTPQEAATYDQRSEQIGREMFYLFAQVADRLKQ